MISPYSRKVLRIHACCPHVCRCESQICRRAIVHIPRKLSLSTSSRRCMLVHNDVARDVKGPDKEQRNSSGSAPGPGLGSPPPTPPRRCRGRPARARPPPASPWRRRRPASTRSGAASAEHTYMSDALHTPCIKRVMPRCQVQHSSALCFGKCAMLLRPQSRSSRQPCQQAAATATAICACRSL